jgi:hypothetical protein
LCHGFTPQRACSFSLWARIAATSLSLNTSTLLGRIGFATAQNEPPDDTHDAKTMAHNGKIKTARII